MRCRCWRGRRRSPATYGSSRRCCISSAASSGWATSAQTSPSSCSCRATRHRKDDRILDTIERMGELARSQASQAKDAFATRNGALAYELVRLDGEIDRLNRDIINRAVDIGNDLEVREWAMFMILVARCRRAHRWKHHRHRRANGVRRDRAISRVRGRIAARIERRRLPTTEEPRSAVGRSSAWARNSGYFSGTLMADTGGFPFGLAPAF